MNPKGFKDLIKEVHEIGICQQCGGCVSFCTSADFDTIAFKDLNSPPEFINEEKCLECGICYCICPQTHILDDDLNKTHNFSEFFSMPIGFIDEIYSCQAKDKDFLKYGTDGGVVNSIIDYLMQKKIIDGAIVANAKAPFSREAMIAKNKKDLLNGSGIKLDISPQLDKIQEFNTYTQSIPKLNHYKFKKLAVVGTPCQIYTIKCMQNLGVVPSENIEICLGLFCFENFFFDKLKIKNFEKEFHIKFEEIEKINIKEDLSLKLNNNGQKILHIPFYRLNNYMRPACYSCYDFTNIYADISFGGLASSDKFTTVLTRTKKGANLFSKVLEAEVIKCLDLDITKKNSMKDLIIEYSRLKIMRYQNFMKNQVETMKFSPVIPKLDIKKF